MIVLLRSFTSVGFVGLIPGAPGTYGSLVTLPLAYVWMTYVTDNILLTIGAIVLMTILGTVASTKVSRSMGLEDPGEIVIDELVGQWIALIAIPNHWFYWLAAFLLFRLFDIWKPGLIDRAQNLPEGLGIMIDDVLAGILALIIIQGVFFIL